MSIDKTTLDRIAKQESQRTSMPTLDELIERLSLLKGTKEFDDFLYIFQRVASGQNLFSPTSSHLQQLAAQAMVILLRHIAP